MVTTTNRRSSSTRSGSCRRPLRGAQCQPVRMMQSIFRFSGELLVDRSAERTTMTSKRDRKAAFIFIIAVGFVSLFADMTYEGARSVVGPFLKELGASATQVGIIAGFGEMIAASLRLFTGRLADRTRAYWLLTASGYFLNLGAVPLLALAGN